ncbi:Copia protein [Phytophthora megakarya]|uniref:Copia protein n=1 Tax=Phytophthora megakarya TaxID=4795 RepID=A0A225VVG9_9STRA|nr:Copia protein [Phytophthora megakarya]
MSPSPVFSTEDSDYAFAMDTASTTTSRINKFDGTNFHTWKFKIRMVLEERDLCEVASGEIKMEHCVTTVGQTTFKRKSRKALAIICLAMEGHFEKKSLANKLFLRRRFFTTMMAEGDDVLEHINKTKTLAEQLDAVGAPVSEDDVVITLLASLSEAYQFLITALESRADSLTWVLVTARLLHEDMKRKRSSKTGACHYCGENGHCIVKCPARIRENVERQKSQRASVAQAEEDGDGYLFSVSGSKSASKSNGMWLVNSGATQHMTYSKEYMKNYKKVSPVDVHLADDGVVQAVGTGNIVMSMKTPHGTKKGVLTSLWHIPKQSRNLFFVGRFTKDVGSVIFESDECFV